MCRTTGSRCSLGPVHAPQPLVRLKAAARSHVMVAGSVVYYPKMPQNSRNGKISEISPPSAPLLPHPPAAEPGASYIVGFGRWGAWQQGKAREDDLQANCGRNLPQICPRFAGYGHCWPSLCGTKEAKIIGHWGIGVQGGTCRCCFTPNVQFYSSDFE